MSVTLEHFADRLARLFNSRFGLILSLAVVLAALRAMSIGADLDLFARLAVGRTIWQSGAVSLQDSFSFMPTKPMWVDHEWLAGLVFYVVYMLSGDLGLFLLQTAAVLATTLLLLAARRTLVGEDRYEVFFALLLNAALYGLWGSPVRCLIFSYFGFALFFYTALGFRRDRTVAPMMLLPLYMIFWANAHAGFVMGLGLLGAFTLLEWCERRWRSPMALVLLLCALTTTLTPYPVDEFWRFIISAIGKERSNIIEWMPIRIASTEGFWSLLWLTSALAGIWLARERKELLLGAGLIALWAYSIQSYRMMAFFYLTIFVLSGPALQRLSQTILPQKKSRVRTFLRACTLSWLLACGWSVIYVSQRSAQILRDGLSLDIFPVAACNWLLSQGHSGKILAHFDMGSYVLWRLSPLFKVAIDGRYEEVYEDSEVALALTALSPTEPGHAKALSIVNPDFILARTEPSISADSATFLGYDALYRDARFTVWSRRQS